MTPVFAWNKTAYTSEQLVLILLGTYAAEETCISQPINVSHNVSFLVDTRSFQHADDLKCDDMGAWKHNGSPKCSFRVVKDSNGIKKIVSMGRNYDKSTRRPSANDYELRRTYYQNTSDPAVRKIVCKLYGTYLRLYSMDFKLQLFFWDHDRPYRPLSGAVPRERLLRSVCYSKVLTLELESRPLGKNTIE